MTEDYTRRAACRGLDSEMFFPRGDDWVTGDNPARALAAKAVCAVCPVRAECLADPVTANDAWAVRGGTTPAERAAERRRAGTRRDPMVAAQTATTRVEKSAAGAALLADGASIAAVARICEVSERTAMRWATRPQVPAPVG